MVLILTQYKEMAAVMMNKQLRNYDLSRQAGAESSLRAMAQAQAEFDSNPLRWQIPHEDIPTEVENRPGGFYVDHPGITMLFSLEMIANRLAPARAMWRMMEAAHDCWVMDNNPNALVMSLVEGIDPELPNDRIWAHEEEGFLPLEALDLKWLAPVLPTYTDSQWTHLVVVWTKMHTLSEEVATFLASQRELTPPERRLRGWITAILQVMIDRKMPEPRP